MKELEEIWKSNLPLIKERISHIEGFSRDQHTRDEAISAAHKLAGSLGSFGYMGASELAREIETRLERGDYRGLTSKLEELKSQIPLK